MQLYHRPRLWKPTGRWFQSELVVEVQSHVVEALEDDLDQEREEVPMVDSRGAAGIPVQIFGFLSRQWETPNVSCP